MSLRARPIDKENAGISARSQKPGEAPSKQVGPKRGLSEMNANQTLGGKSKSGLGLSQPKVETTTKPKTVRKNSLFDAPIEQMHYLPNTNPNAFSDPLIDQLIGKDFKDPALWGITAPSLDLDYFSKENDQFGLCMEDVSSYCPETDYYSTTEMDIPDSQFYADAF